MHPGKAAALAGGARTTPMTNTVLLDNVAHKDLRVKAGYSAEFGDSVNGVIVFPTEFVYVHREYPILFRRDANGELVATALLGFDEGENLFLDEKGWNARYVPAIQQRGPFLIGLRKDAAGDPRDPMVQVDLDHPRISRSEGLPLFLPQGGNSPYLEHVSRILQIIYQGSGQARPMFAAFEDAGLIESVDLDAQLDRTTTYKLPGFFTVSHEKLAALDGATLERLHRQGFLQLAMHIVSSLGNVHWLIELKNRKRAAAGA